MWVSGRMRKRLIAGLREVTKQVERNRVKMIFLAPDIQRCPETGGLDEAVLYLLELARKGNLPVVYALSRRKIGRVLKKNVPVSCCGILNHQGTEETWRKLSELVARAKEEYQAKALFFYEKSIVSDATEVEASAESPEEILSSPVRVEPKSTQLPETNVLLELIRSSWWRAPDAKMKKKLRLLIFWFGIWNNKSIFQYFRSKSQFQTSTGTLVQYPSLPNGKFNLKLSSRKTSSVKFLA